MKVVRKAQWFFSVEAGETLLAQTVDFLGDEHFMYASDFPHWDAEFPQNIDELWQHKGLSTKTKEKILCHNSKAFFGLE